MDDRAPADILVEEMDRRQALEAELRSTCDFLRRLRQVRPCGSWILIATCLGIFAATELAGGSQNSQVLLRFGADNAALVRAGESWRLFSSMFLHVGWVHLLVNMYSLWAVGPFVERFYGHLRFLALYGASGLAASGASNLAGVAGISAGASGAIFGLAGAVAVLGWRYRQQLPPPLRGRLVGGMLAVIALNLLLGFSVEGINNAAHIGGLGAGALFTFLVPPRMARPPTRLALPALSLLALLAAAPFLAEGYALYRAARYPRPVFPLLEASGPGYTLSYPALLRAEPGGEVLVLTGPGLGLVVLSASQPGATELRRQVEGLAREQGADPSRLQVIRVKGWPWLTVALPPRDHRQGRLAATRTGDRLFLLNGLWDTDEAALGEQVFDQVLASLELRPPRPLGPALERELQGDFAGALALLDELVRRRPTALACLERGRLRVSRALARRQERQALLEAAVADFNRALELSPGDLEALLNRAQALGELGRPRQAVADLDQALQRLPASWPAEERAWTYNARGWWKVQAGDYAGGLADANRALDLAPSAEGLRAAALDTRAHALAGLGRHEEAVKAFRQALELAPGQEESLYGLARSYEALGRRPEALAAWRDFLAAHPQDPARLAQARRRIQALQGPEAVPPGNDAP
jgi:membrane associated rhomboid family serine protease/tetratricopeptide (TPR) repeat protein